MSCATNYATPKLLQCARLRCLVGSVAICRMPAIQQHEHNSALQKLCGARGAIWSADLQSALLAFAHFRFTSMPSTTRRSRSFAALRRLSGSPTCSRLFWLLRTSGNSMSTTRRSKGYSALAGLSRSPTCTSFHLANAQPSQPPACALIRTPRHSSALCYLAPVHACGARWRGLLYEL